MTKKMVRNLTGPYTTRIEGLAFIHYLITLRSGIGQEYTTLARTDP